VYRLTQVHGLFFSYMVFNYAYLVWPGYLALDHDWAGPIVEGGLEPLIR
jgi:hypothetical protein